MVYDVETGVEVLTLQGHQHNVDAVDYSPDGQQIASAGPDRIVRVWKAESGELVHELRGPNSPIVTVVYDPQGRWLAAHAMDGAVWVWEAGTGAVLQTLTGFPTRHAATRAAVSPDGTWLAIGGDEGIKVWETSSWAEKRSFPSPAAWVSFGPDSRNLFAAAHNGAPADATVSRWDLETGTALPPLTLSHHGKWLVYCLSPDGKTLFEMGADQFEPFVYAFETATGQERTPRADLPGPARSLAFSPDGNTLATGSQSGSVQLWDLAGWREGDRLPPVRTLTRQEGEIWWVVFSPDGQTLATTGPNRNVVLRDVANGRETTVPFDAALDCMIAFSPDGKTLAIPQSDGTVVLYDVASGTTGEPLRLHSGSILGVAFSPDGRMLASSSVDHTLRITDLTTRRGRQVFKGFDCQVIAFSPDGTTLAATTNFPDARLRLWNTKTLKEIPFRSKHQDRAGGLAFHPAGTSLATVDLSSKARVWDLANGGARSWASGSKLGGARQTVGYSPDGRYLATITVDGVVTIARVPASPADTLGPAQPVPAPAALASRQAPADSLKREEIPADRLKLAGRREAGEAPSQLVAVLRPEPGPVVQITAVAVSPDGRQVASAAHDGTVRLWETATGALLDTITRPDGNAYCLAFTPDSKTLIAGWRADGTISARGRRRHVASARGARRRADHPGALARRFTPRVSRSGGSGPVLGPGDRSPSPRRADDPSRHLVVGVQPRRPDARGWRATGSRAVDRRRDWLGTRNDPLRGSRPLGRFPPGRPVAGDRRLDRRQRRRRLGSGQTDGEVPPERSRARGRGRCLASRRSVARHGRKRRGKARPLGSEPRNPRVDAGSRGRARHKLAAWCRAVAGGPTRRDRQPGRHGFRPAPGRAG